MGLRLELSQISKAYNGLAVLQDCSLNCAAGRATVLMGDNGAGKSTLLRIAALLEEPDQGQVRYFSGERLLAHNLELKRRLTLVLPKLGLFNASVYDNVAYGLKVRGLPRGVIEARVGEVLELVGLADKRQQRALELSSGQAKRLGLARALVLNPEVLFLDEPTTFLDRWNREIIEQGLTEIIKNRDLTLVLVTHDLEQARRLGDRLVVLDAGKIVSEGGF